MRAIYGREREKERYRESSSNLTCMHAALSGPPPRTPTGQEEGVRCACQSLSGLSSQAFSFQLSWGGEGSANDLRPICAGRTREYLGQEILFGHAFLALSAAG